MPPASDPTDLRSRILATARQLLDEGGVPALSLREVARRAGVTHQAPYHHFADRETIVAALVTDGFGQLADALAAANDVPADTAPAEVFVASGLAYVGFALAQPGVFRVMFRPELCDPTRFPQAQAAGERAHGELVRMVTRVTAGRVDADEQVALATLAWAQVHGLAGLFLDGPLGLACPGREARLMQSAGVLRRLAVALLAGLPAAGGG